MSTPQSSENKSSPNTFSSYVEDILRRVTIQEQHIMPMVDHVNKLVADFTMYNKSFIDMIKEFDSRVKEFEKYKEDANKNLEALNKKFEEDVKIRTESLKTLQHQSNQLMMRSQENKIATDQTLKLAEEKLADVEKYKASVEKEVANICQIGDKMSSMASTMNNSVSVLNKMSVGNIGGKSAASIIKPPKLSHHRSNTHALSLVDAITFADLLDKRDESGSVSNLDIVESDDIKKLTNSINRLRLNPDIDPIFEIDTEKVYDNDEECDENDTTDVFTLGSDSTDEVKDDIKPDDFKGDVTDDEVIDDIVEFCDDKKDDENIDNTTEQYPIAVDDVNINSGDIEYEIDGEKGSDVVDINQSQKIPIITSQSDSIGVESGGDKPLEQENVINIESGENSSLVANGGAIDSGEPEEERICDAVQVETDGDKISESNAEKCGIEPVEVVNNLN